MKAALFIVLSLSALAMAGKFKFPFEDKTQVPIQLKDTAN